MRILIGVDGSAASLDAVRLVGRLVNPAADVVAAYFSPLELEKRLPGRPKKIVDGAAAALFEEVQGLLPRGFASAPEMICSSKTAAIGILEAAAGWKADLVVVGARGHGGIERFLLGSVSRAVVHGANLPVLVARRPPAAALGALVCHHPASAAAVARLLGRIAWPADTSGRVIGVAESLLVGQVPAWIEKRVRDPDAEAMAQAWRQEHDDEVAALGGRLKAFQAELPPPFRGQPPIIAQGNAGERILEQATALGTDLVVVGRTPTDAVSRWLLGSTSEAVLTHAAASVLVVPVERA